MRSSGFSLSRLSSALLLASPALAFAQASPCVQGDLGQPFTHQAFTAQRSRFTTTVDVTPSSNALLHSVGLSQGARQADGQFAALLRFNAAGQIEALNGSAFAAERTVAYKPELTYRVRFDVDVAARSYSAWVQRREGAGPRAFVRIAKDFAFPPQLAVTQLDSLGVRQASGSGVPDYTTGDTVQACALAVAPTAEAPPNPACSLIVPADPLSPAGLATPYQLVATDPAQGACHQANAAQSAFVQAVILDPATGQLSTYAPLVIDGGTRPAVAPTAPTLPANAVVALWFGYNGDTLTLQAGARGALRGGRCVNGLGDSVFGQFAYCNAPAFFTAASAALQAGRLTLPALGTGADGKACPSSRSYWVIDQDPSDNVPAEYLNVNGRFAQSTAANRARFPRAVTFGNPSDERLVARSLDPALGCAPVILPDLADPGQQVATLATNELQAALYQAAPVALVPVQDPMVLVDGQRSLAKLNAYRAGVGQPLASNVSDASARATCQALRDEAPARFLLDRPWFVNAASPAPDVANNLFTFLANRYVAAYGLLDCRALLGKRVNLRLTKNAAGIVVDATLRSDGR
jgi:hypothetical protein